MTSQGPVPRETPAPSRRGKWLRRVLILAGGLLLLFAFWGILNLWLGSAFQREVDALRARGEPTSLAEMAPTTRLPPDQDAAVLIREAIRIYDANIDPLLKVLEAAVKAAGYEDASGGGGLAFDATLAAENPGLLAEFPSEVGAIREAAGPMVERLRKARDLRSYDMGVDFSAPFSVTFSSLNLSRLRAMAKVCVLLAAEAHHRGDDAEVIQHIRDHFTLSRRATECPLLISELVALYIEAIAEGQNNPNTLHRLRIGRVANDPAREAAQALMQILLDPNRPRDRFVRCMKGERAFSCTETGAVLSGVNTQALLMGSQNVVVNNPALRALCRPVLGSDAAAYLRGMSSVVAAAGQDDCPSAVARLDFPPPRQSTIGQMLHPFTPSGYIYTTALEVHFRRVAGMRMAGTALAVRMYELDKGRPIARLEDLVPDYLHALPKDPFDANGGPIRMGRWGGRDLLYCVGGAGKDMGGQYAADPNDSPHTGADKYNWPYFLRGDGPRRKIVKRAPQTSPSSGPALPDGTSADSEPGEKISP